MFYYFLKCTLKVPYFTPFWSFILVVENIYLRYKYQKTSQYTCTALLSGERKTDRFVLSWASLLIDLLFSEWPRKPTVTYSDAELMSQLRHRASCKTKGKLEEGHSNQCRFGASYISSLKHHLVVMWIARIDVIQPQIRKMIAYLLPLPDDSCG